MFKISEKLEKLACIACICRIDLTVTDNKHPIWIVRSKSREKNQIRARIRSKTETGSGKEISIQWSSYDWESGEKTSSWITWHRFKLKPREGTCVTVKCEQQLDFNQMFLLELRIVKKKKYFLYSVIFCFILCVFLKYH